MFIQKIKLMFISTEIFTIAYVLYIYEFKFNMLRVDLNSVLYTNIIKVNAPAAI